jgi:hypothetical protein
VGGCDGIAISKVNAEKYRLERDHMKDERDSEIPECY